MLILTVPSKLKEGDKFVAKVTTKDGKPVENAKVSYGNLTKYTNASGEVMLTALGNVNKIEVGKENYSVFMENLNIEKAKPQTEILFLIAAVLLIVILSLLFALLRKRNKKDEKSEEKAAEVEEEEKPEFAGEGGLAGLSNVGDVKDEEKQEREKGGLGGLNY